MRTTFSYLKKHFVITICVFLLLAVSVICAVVANVAHDTQASIGATFTFNPEKHKELKGKDVVWEIEITSITKNGVPVGANGYNNLLKKSKNAPKTTVSKNLNKDTDVKPAFGYYFNFPEEGTWVVNYKITCKLAGTNTVVSTQTSSETFDASVWPTQSGVCIPPGWTQNPDGSITTPTPNPPTEQGPSIVSDATYPNGFEMSFNFTFPPSSANGPVVPPGKDPTKPSFYPNSGIYIYGVSEVQIFDTNALIAAGYTTPNSDGKIYKDGKDTGELTSGTRSGIPYRNDTKDTEDLQYASTYHPNLTSNLQQAGTANNMTISVRPDPNTGEKILTVTVNNVQTYSEPLPSGTGSMINATPNEYIYIQSHWGSSVTYSDITIQP